MCRDDFLAASSTFMRLLLNKKRVVLPSVSALSDCLRYHKVYKDVRDEGVG